MTNHLSGDPTDDRRTRRPVKLVEHPAFRGRGERPVVSVPVGHLGALRVVSLSDTRRTDRGARIPIPSMPEVA